MHRISALNSLQVRSFRDSEHKTEMVFELINDLEQLLTSGSVDRDVQRRDYLLRCFRGFSGALKMMNRTTSYDAAVLAALNWESSVISKAEEAMIQAGIKRQLKSQIAPTRAKRKSNSTQPIINRSEQQGAKDLAHELITQDFRANPQPVRLHPDVYHKTHLSPSQLKRSSSKTSAPKHSHPIHQRFDDPCHIEDINQRLEELNNQSFPFKKPTVSNPGGTSNVPFTAGHLTAGTKDDTDPSQMMESLVDPHLNPTQPQQSDETDSYYEHLRIDDENDLRKAGTNQKVAIKPLVYDPQKNPYPPPEQLAENKKPAQYFRPESSSFAPPVSLTQNQTRHPISSVQDWRQAGFHDSTSLPQPTGIRFPSPRVPPQTQAVPKGSLVRRSPVPPNSNLLQQSTSMLPGSSSSQRGTPLPDSGTNYDSATSSHFVSAQFAQSQNSIEPAIPRRPSKLVKLRRRESSNSSNSSLARRSTGSFRHLKDFLHRRGSQGSQSANESDPSARDHGPTTPTSLGPGGVVRCGVDDEGNERLRPMQAQFFRLFRKHNHPDHLRRQHRAMLLQRPSSSQKAAKGKARAASVETAATSTDDEFVMERKPTQASSRLSHPQNDRSTHLIQSRHSVDSMPVRPPDLKRKTTRRSRWGLGTTNQ